MTVPRAAQNYVPRFRIGRYFRPVCRSARGHEAGAGGLDCGNPRRDVTGCSSGPSSSPARIAIPSATSTVTPKSRKLLRGGFPSVLQRTTNMLALRLWTSRSTARRLPAGTRRQTYEFRSCIRDSHPRFVRRVSRHPARTKLCPRQLRHHRTRRGGRAIPAPSERNGRGLLSCRGHIAGTTAHLLRSRSGSPQGSKLSAATWREEGPTFVHRNS